VCKDQVTQGGLLVEEFIFLAVVAFHTPVWTSGAVTHKPLAEEEEE
jgi:hypothetical protein